MKLTDNYTAPFGIVHNLRLMYVSRWNIISMDRKQSVAEHCYNVVVITEWICGILGYTGLTKRRLIEEAISHDSDEIFTGDIPSPAKMRNGCAELSTSNIIKIADIIEAIRYVHMHCNDTASIERWVLCSLSKELYAAVDIQNDLTYSMVEPLIEETK